MLILPHHLSNFEIIKCFNYETRFNYVFTRDKLPKIKDGLYFINLDDKECHGTHWVSLFTDKYITVYFDSFGIEYIP